jgi:hypothetical protein
MQISADLDTQAWVARLHYHLRTMVHHPALSLGDNLTLSVGTFREAALQAQATAMPGDRAYADFLVAYGSDAVPTESGGKETGVMADTAFRTMSGSGHQHFLATMRVLAADSELEHLTKALLEPWRYDDPVEKHTMRWDPSDDVRYALQWQNPSGDPDRRRGGRVWGTNRWFVSAVPRVPVQPAASWRQMTSPRGGEQVPQRHVLVLHHLHRPMAQKPHGGEGGTEVLLRLCESDPATPMVLGHPVLDTTHDGAPSGCESRAIARNLYAEQ